MKKGEYKFVSNYMKKENKRFTNKLKQLDLKEYSHFKSDPMPDEVWRSNQFLVQIFFEEPIRISVNRTTIKPNGHWEENITWNELQEIKNQCGYKNKAAVEIYPPDEHIVELCNIRHIWVLNKPPFFMWK